MSSTCPSRKAQYRSKPEAKRAARQTETTGSGAKVGRIRPYRCPDCGWWHLGHDRFRDPIRERSAS